MEIVQINFLDIPEDNNYKELINTVLTECFKEEKLMEKKLYVNIVLTNPESSYQIQLQR